MALESEYNIRFKDIEIESMRSANTMIDLIYNKTKC